MRALTLNEVSYVSGGFDQTEDPLHPDLGLPGQGTVFGSDQGQPNGSPSPQSGCAIIGGIGDVLKKAGPEGKIVGSLADVAGKACDTGTDTLKQGMSDQDKAERCMETGNEYDNQTHSCK